MIDLVRSWLLGVTGVAILAAMADNLMPQGTVKGVGRLTGGLVLLVAMLTPVLSLDLNDLLGDGQWEASLTATEEGLEESRKKELEAIIAQELGAYIVDKAGEEGILCTATVTCYYEGEVFLPEGATIYGVTEEGQQAILRQMVAEALDILQENINFVEEGVG